MPIAWLLTNWQLVLKIAGIAALTVLLYWAFLYNPKVIKELEEEKAEMGRIIQAKNAEITLYKDIEAGKVLINKAVQGQISTLRSEGRPRRTIIIKAGRPVK